MLYGGGIIRVVRKEVEIQLHNMEYRPGTDATTLHVLCSVAHALGKSVCISWLAMLVVGNQKS
jgi:hypothetical protein